jgi:hypothetical protein
MTSTEVHQPLGRPTLHTWLEPATWVGALKEFTVRNVGRHARLEVDDPALGAPVQQRGDTVLGAAYDPLTRRVEITLAEAPAGGLRHHVRSIAGVTSVDLLTGSSGRDLMLRIAHAHGRGQTLLTLLN